MVALRLFLPDSWVNDRRRLKRAGVPADIPNSAGQARVALADRRALPLCAGGCRLRSQCAFPSRADGPQTFLGGSRARHLKVYPVGVQLIWPVTKVRGRPRKRHVPDSLSTAAEDMLASAQWRTVSWRSGTKGRLKAQRTAVRVRTADGPPQRIWDKGQQHLPGDEAWLIGEHRASGEKKYYLANLAAGMDPPQLSCDDKGTMDLRAGPSTVEGGTRARPLRGKVLARPSSSCADGDDCLRVPPTSPAQKSEAGKKESTARPSTDVAGGSPRHRRPHHAIKSSRCPYCRSWISEVKQRE